MEGAVVLLQGTQRRYDPDLGQQTLAQQHYDTHLVIEARVPIKRKGKCQPEGVAMMVPPRYQAIIKSIYTPSAPELQGRGLAVRLSRGIYDVCYMTMYCPLGGQDPQGHRKCEKLWQWASQVKARMPARTHMIIGVDANGHVGSKRYYTTEDVDLGEGANESGVEYPHIGPHGQEEENGNVNS